MTKSLNKSLICRMPLVSKKQDGLCRGMMIIIGMEYGRLSYMKVYLQNFRRIHFFGTN